MTTSSPAPTRPTLPTNPRPELGDLMHKRDTPGLVRLGVQLAWLLASTLVIAKVWSTPWVWPAVASAGLALVTFFPPLHEAAHKTAFATPVLNDLTVWLCAPLMLQAPSFFREFHGQHHRATQDLEHDPEIAPAPALLDDWPSNPVSYLLMVCGQPLLFGKLMFTVVCALAPRTVWEKAFPFIRSSRQRRVAWESRAVLVVLAAGVWAGLSFVPGFAHILLVWPVSHLVLGLYLMPEHTGLPHDGSQVHRTRSVNSNALVRWFMWNMPHHAEHHTHPAVPFHALPRLRARMDLEHVSSGYVSFHVEAIKRAFGWRPMPHDAQRAADG